MFVLDQRDNTEYLNHTHIQLETSDCSDLNFDHVIELKCIGLNLTHLPPLPNCEKLNCSHNNLTSLPDLPKCKKLNCIYNRITTLPNLTNCEKLNCANNIIVCLPNLPKCKMIFCQFNELKQLPELPKCEHLTCSFNKLTALPELPKCEILCCEYNRIQELPFMPCINTIYCGSNKIKSLPRLNCEALLCGRNEIRFIHNEITAEYVDLSDNQLTSYPHLIYSIHLNLCNNKIVHVDTATCSKLSLSFNPIKDYNILELRKNKHVCIEFDRHCKVKTLKVRNYHDVCFVF